MSEKQKKVKRSKAAKQVAVIRILNPFNPTEKTVEYVKWKSTKTLLEYFPLEASQVIISVNGKIIPPEEQGRTYLSESDNVVICPVPAGGGGNNKQILSIVAMIAISAVTAGAGAALASSMGLTGMTATIAGGIMQAGIMMAGSMLVHSIFAPSTPSKSATATSSPTYGIDGAKNTSVEGIPVPICYGEFRMAGNVVDMYTTNDDGSNQTLYMLISAGEGPISGITGVELNDNPITDYQNVEVMTRAGLSSQDIIPWFNKIITPHNIGLKLSESAYIYHTTEAMVDMLSFDIVAPQGLCSVSSSDGSLHRVSVPIAIDYRAAGSEEWIQLQNTTDDLSWRDPEQVEVHGVGDLARNVAANAFRMPEYNTSLGIAGATRSAARKTFTSPKLANGRYEIRIKRLTEPSKDLSVSDVIYISSINEIQNELITFPNTALLALKIKLSDQITGVPNVTFIHGGRMINVYGRQSGDDSDGWYQAASKNPAWIVWDILTNKRYGGQMEYSRLDFIAFKNWAAYCDKQNLQWNGVIDTEMNVWDACQLVLRVGHAQLVNVGTRYTVVVEAPANPVMMFSVANIVEGTYKETWLSTADRANEIDVTYFDKKDKYKQKTLKLYEPDVIASGKKTRSSAITLYGVDNFDTALKEAMFQLNLNRYVLKTVTFSSSMEAVACTVGDVILVQNDMTDWAVAGRFDAGSTTSVMNLDRDVTMLPNVKYKLLTISNSVVRYTGSILNVVGDSVLLTGFDGLKTVKRLVVGGKDLHVAGVFQQGAGAYGVILDGPQSIPVGAAYSLIDTDVIQEFDVVNTGKTGNTITLQSPMPFAPLQFDHWMFGETQKVKAPFRVKSITGNQNYTREITAIQYDERIYSFDRFQAAAAPLDSSIQIGKCTDLTTYENTFVAGAGIVSEVVASWRAPVVGYYMGADIYVQINDGELTKVASVNNVTSYTVKGVAKGDRVKVKTVAFDVFGKRALFEAAPESTYVVVGQISSIKVGDVTGVDLYWSGVDCKLSWHYNSVTSSYEFGSEPTGADAGALDPHFKDYEVRVYDAAHEVLRRTEYVTSDSYTYTRDKNFADGLTRHLVFEIRMRDIFNNLGQPTILDAYNPPPSITSQSIKPSYDSAVLTYTHTDDADFAGVMVFLSDFRQDVMGDPNSDAMKRFLVYKGPDTSVTLPGLLFSHNYYASIYAYDVFGTSELNGTPAISFKTTTMNVDAIADGVLSSSKLTGELQKRIELIDAGTDVQGSVASRIAEEQQKRAQAIADEQQKRAQAIADEARTRAQALLQEAEARQAAIAQESIVRQTATDSLAKQIQTVSAAVGENASAISSEATARASAVEAVSKKVDTVAAKADNALSLVQTETLTRAQETSSLSAQVETVSAGVGKNTADITSVSKAVADLKSTTAESISTISTAYKDADAQTLSSAKSFVQDYAYSKSDSDSSLATKITTLRTEFQNADTGTLTAAKSYVQNYAYSKSDADSSAASLLSTVRTEFQSGDTNAINSAKSYVQNYAYSKSDVDSAVASQSSALTTAFSKADENTLTNAVSYVQTYAYSKSAVDGSIASLSSSLKTEFQRGDGQTLADAKSYVQSYTYSRSDVDGAVASQTTTLQAQFKSADDKVLTTAQSYVQNYAYSKATVDESIAASINTVQSSLNGQTTTIQQLSESVNGLSGQYTVKIDNNGYVAGFGLASYPINGNITSEFTIRADAFSVVLPTYPALRPFVIGAVGGKPQVIMNSAMIGDAAIGSAQIGKAQVDTLRIGNNAVTIPAFMSGYGGNWESVGWPFNNNSFVFPGQQSPVVGSVTLKFPDDVDLAIMCNWQVFAGPEGTNTGVRVIVDGKELFSRSNSTPANYTTAHSATGKSRLSAGTHTFSVLFYNDWRSGYWKLNDWSVLILGVMR